MSLIQIRKNVFETNSSSVHTLVLCGEKEYTSWINGEAFFDYQDECIRTIAEIQDDIQMAEDFAHKDDVSVHSAWEKRFLTYDEFNSYDFIDYETFDTSKGINGVEVHAFGWYGHD